MKSYDERLLVAAYEVLNTAPADNPMGGITAESLSSIAITHKVGLEL